MNLELQIVAFVIWSIIYAYLSIALRNDIDKHDPEVLNILNKQFAHVFSTILQIRDTLIRVSNVHHHGLCALLHYPRAAVHLAQIYPAIRASFLESLGSQGRGRKRSEDGNPL